MASTAVETFETTVRAVITVVLIYASGFLLVKFDLIDGGGVRVLSTLSRYLFIPLLFFTSLGSGMDLETLKNAWQLPVLGFVIMIFNLLVARFILEPLAKPTKKFRRFFILSQTFANIVALPLVLISTMCAQVQFPKPEYSLSDEENEILADNSSTVFIYTEEDCKERGELYLFMYTLLIAVIIWTVGLEYASGGKVIDDSNSESTSVAEKDGVPEKVADEQSEAQTTPDPEKPTEKLSKTQKAKNFGAIFVRNLKTPIMAAQFLGIVVGLIVPLQNAFFDKKGVLQPLTEAADLLAEGAISVVNLILSVTLALKINSLAKWSDIFGNEETLGASRRTLFWMAFGRMIFIPAVQFCILKLVETYWFDFIPQGDELLKFVAYLELFTPTANMVVVIAQIVGPTENAEIVALSILLQYMIGIFSITGYTFLTLFWLDVEY